MPNSPTSPTSATVALAILQSLAAESGVVTDYNQGSVIRTLSEAIGGVVERQSAASYSAAYQASLEAAWGILGVTAAAALSAQVTLTFTYSGSTSHQDITIPAGTTVSTTGGVAFDTNSAVTIVAPNMSTTVVATADRAGSLGNVGAGTITQVVSSVSVPLSVTNLAAATGGADAETPSQTHARFLAELYAVNAASPNALAGGVVGQTDGTNVVEYASVYEAWISAATPTAGYTVYIDDGSGTATTSLVTTVTDYLNASTGTSLTNVRPSGVPFSVVAGTATDAYVAITGTLASGASQTTAQTLAEDALTAYNAGLGFGVLALASAVNVAVADALSGLATGLEVTLSLTSGGASVASVDPTYAGRVILATPTFTWA